MQAILTKILPATNYKGTRIKATCQRGSMTVSCPHELSGENCHIYAVKMLCEKFDNEDVKQYGSTSKSWSKPKACGQLPNGDYVHVFTGDKI